MPINTKPRSEAGDHAQAMERAANYFLAAARRGDLGASPTEFDARVKAFFSQLEASRAYLLAVLADCPCPVEFFKPWASRKTVFRWRKAATDPLPSVVRNQKVLVKPSDFFIALEIHGREKPVDVAAPP